MEFVLYSDKIKSRVLMIYIFDYGELLGEGGVYLYGLFYVFVLLE